MGKTDLEDTRYRVFLIGIEEPAEEKKESFCHNISKKYGIPFPLLEKIVSRSPIVFKKNLTLERAISLAKILKSHGGRVSVEEKSSSTPLFLEFQKIEPHQVALESSHLRRSQNGAWNVIGRARNISTERLDDTWVLVQLFDNRGELLTFEEVPTSINPLPPGEASPFKAVFEGDLSIQKISLTFKNSSGNPVSAVDRREKEEWVEVSRDEDDEEALSIEIIERPHKIKFAEPLDERARELKIASPPAEKWESMTGERGDAILEDSPGLLLEDDSIEIGSKISDENGAASTMAEENQWLGAQVLEPSPEWEASEQPGLDEQAGGKQGEKGEVLSESNRLPENQEMTLQKLPVDPTFARAPVLPGEIPEGSKEKELSSFPWMEDFRISIENYCKENPNPFFAWFESCRKNGKFENPLHVLLTILVYARFDQMNERKSALENTQRVFTLSLHPTLSLEEIPTLEGTQFFSAEHWRELFHRALPKLRQTAKNIMDKSKWDALELERLIQVVPHMSNKTSRWAARWIHALTPDLVEVGFSDTPISIEQNLYRVASRLGVVDPHFDYCDRRNSAGNLKIQAFAKEAFPSYPVRIEEPMIRIGMNEEGGHCFSIQPRCEGCLFETFCQRLYLNFDPSEKGMAD